MCGGKATACPKGTCYAAFGKRTHSGFPCVEQIPASPWPHALLLTSPAQSAELRPAYKAPAVAPAPAVHNWSGFYLGGQVGGAFADSSWSTDATRGGVFVPVSHDDSSWIAGGQVGLRYQVSNWVFGIEGMWSGTDLENNAPSQLLADAGFANRFRGTDISSIYSVTGQIGYAWDRWLAYAKGGWAGAEVDLSTRNANNGIFSSTSFNAGGWTIGGGLEFAFGNGWSLAAEYGYYDLDAGALHSAIQTNGDEAFYRDFETRIHTVVARLNYTFNWVGKRPVVAKY